MQGEEELVAQPLQLVEADTGHDVLAHHHARHEGLAGHHRLLAVMYHVLVILVHRADQWNEGNLFHQSLPGLHHSSSKELQSWQQYDSVAGAQCTAPAATNTAPDQPPWRREGEAGDGVGILAVPQQNGEQRRRAAAQRVARAHL